jgi:hypothetical protein
MAPPPGPREPPFEVLARRDQQALDGHVQPPLPEALQPVLMLGFGGELCYPDFSFPHGLGLGHCGVVTVHPIVASVRTG